MQSLESTLRITFPNLHDQIIVLLFHEDAEEKRNHKHLFKGLLFPHQFLVVLTHHLANSVLQKRKKEKDTKHQPVKHLSSTHL